MLERCSSAVPSELSCSTKAARSRGGATAHFFGFLLLAATAVFFRPGEAMNVCTRAPSAIFQTRTSPFQAPAAIKVASGLTARAYPQSFKPLSVCTCLLVALFQMRTVLSALHVARRGVW